MKNIVFFECCDESLVDKLNQLSTNNFKVGLSDSSVKAPTVGWEPVSGDLDEYYYLMSFTEELYEVYSRQYRLEPLKSLSIQDYHLEIKHQYIYIKDKYFSLSTPDVVLFGDYPHDAYSCIAAIICAYKSIPFFIMHHVPVAPFFAMVPGGSKEKPFECDIKNRIKPNTNLYEEYRDITNSEYCINKYFEQMQNSKKYSYLPSFTERKVTSLRKQIFSSYNISKNIQRFLWNMLVVIRDRKYVRLISQIVSQKEAPLSIPYVYYPLHLQPEMTTSAMGGRILNDQFLVATLLAIIASKYDVNIVIKDNPVQSFSHRNAKALYALAGMKNVYFVSTFHPSIDLVRDSILVATITGTAGFEAICNNKPSLALGNAWYSEFKGVVRTFNDFESFLEKRNQASQDFEAEKEPLISFDESNFKEFVTSLWPGCPKPEMADLQFELEEDVNRLIMANSILNFISFIEGNS